MLVPTFKYDWQLPTSNGSILLGLVQAARTTTSAASHIASLVIIESIFALVPLLVDD